MLLWRFLRVVLCHHGNDLLGTPLTQCKGDRVAGCVVSCAYFIRQQMSPPLDMELLLNEVLGEIKDLHDCI